MRKAKPPAATERSLERVPVLFKNRLIFCAHLTGFLLIIFA